MKYASLQEYFYKFQNVLFVLVLLPLLAFISLFLFNGFEFHDSLAESVFSVQFFAGIYGTDILISFFLFNAQLKKIRKLPSLGLRLEKYYTITLVRFSLLSCAALLMVAAFALAPSVVFTGLFAVVLILFLLLWPRSRKVCRDLKLKGSEREMVYYKKMTLD